jgi:membrane-associated phospholipid phosphatase
LAINGILFLLGLFFFIPKEKRCFDLFKNIIIHYKFLLIIFLVVALHLFEVNVIDSPITSWLGFDFTENIIAIEDGAVNWFSQNWIPVLVYFFVFIYIGVYIFTLWFTPLFFLIINDKNAMKNFAYGFLILYLVALPFFLFFPVTNVYTYFNSSSALENVLPSIEGFFYSTTTQNNCLPSLHTAMTILIAYTVYLTGNKKYTYFTGVTMVLVIISVIYLSIHWITDVIAGLLLSIGVILLLRRYMAK